jgi:hypothetical protein
VEYLSESHANVTWKATRCNFASVKKINIQQNGSSVLSYPETNWNNETEIGYQIVENITVVEHQTYFWNVSVVYGEGVEEARSQSSPVFEAPVVGKLRVGVKYYPGSRGLFLLISLRRGEEK